MSNIELFIEADGTIQAVYDDVLPDLFESEGKTETRRASHVEPVPGGWMADLAPIRGPLLGPFRTRAEALAREVEWLKAQMQQERLEWR